MSAAVRYKLSRRLPDTLSVLVVSDRQQSGWVIGPTWKLLTETHYSYNLFSFLENHYAV
ncbi:MAG: hypothetical protein N0C81_12925 [Candidatus Thiodiazotropha lotti]|uniref:Uncharacterized protein n=1 Tax=Candidatus Thiodiazotropha lotti TaxID=2792787 RepID=A0A9E4K5H3_9GAMM|nr:hypothetical protein [Candidatus Thiodiazotropha lotti]MCG7922605.1 hypothetical protein [Candidatus Thiodiazotropha lotti]MCG7928822.1 hypothetical protein [Candidatus Thiodiazotropha lotti]MCG7939413.1 hypothetical protein [Candidatus Thiodiazotropha lotti]MCG7987336.1 hypothetical protein [Candidatus Thiodiazotropha lotti]